MKCLDLIKLIIIIFLYSSVCLANTEDLFSKATNYIEKNDYSSALNLLNENYIDEINNRGALFHYYYGLSLLKSGKAFLALNHFVKSYIYSDESLPIKEESLFLRAKIYYDLNLYNEAANIYKIYLGIFNRSQKKEEIQLNLAKCLIKMGQYSDAIVLLDKLNKNPDAIFQKANLFQIIGNVKEAAEYYKTGMIAKPDLLINSEETLYYYCLNLIKRRMIDEAVKHLESIKTLNIKYKAAIVLGDIYTEKNNHDRALSFFKFALESTDKKIKSQALLKRGRLYFKIGNYEKAEKEFLEIITNYPYTEDYYFAILSYSELLFSNNRVDESIRYLKTLIFKNKPYLEAYKYLSSAYEKYIEENKIESVLELWKKTGKMVLEFLNDKTIFELANILKENKNEDFINLYLKISKKNSYPYSDKSRFELAKYYFKIGNIEKSKEFAALISKNFFDDEIRRFLTYLYYYSGNHNDAYKTLLEVSSFKVQDVNILLRLIENEKKIHRKIMVLERALLDIGENEVLYEVLSEYYQILNNQNKYAEYLQKILKINPQNIYAKYELYKIKKMFPQNESRDLSSDKEEKLMAKIKDMLQKEDLILGLIKEESFGRVN